MVVSAIGMHMTSGLNCDAHRAICTDRTVNDLTGRHSDPNGFSGSRIVHGFTGTGYIKTAAGCLHLNLLSGAHHPRAS